MEVIILATLLAFGSMLLVWLWHTRGMSSPSTPTLAICLVLLALRLIKLV